MDVLEYEIVDGDNGKSLGWFYLDLVPRPSRFLRPVAGILRAGRQVGGEYSLPIGAIMGNTPPSEPGKPSLLSHRDVVDLFHEFGHLLHATLSTAPYEALNGLNARGDFLEAPSQMFENWAWQPAILEQISRDVETGRRLPRELAEQLVASRHSFNGATWTRQVLFAVYDLTLHTSGARVDATATWFKLTRELTALPPVPGTAPEAGFIFLMGGYDAGYYGYLWSKVAAQDLFSAFESGGIENPEVGRRFRREVLEPGATMEPDQLLRTFLGRPASDVSFRRSLGLER